ncbi:hypothetical protein COCOBI_08-4090 [Coccomyxa sp. Obi]|nr:hypothetical protein COCOBI_08-4090 [Coccomyxa sp. Obi]
MMHLWALVLLLSSFLFHAESLDTVVGHSNDLQRVEGSFSFWERTANAAALVTAEEIQKQQSSEGLKLGNVRLASLKLLQGQQERLTVELDGQQHRVLFSDERQWQSLSDALPVGKGGSELSTQSASELWSSSLEESAVLPDFTLTGPLELVLTEAQPISLYVPHQADAGLVRRILLQPGAALTIHKARSVALRRPLDLPLLPDSYVANVWGRAVRGTTPGAPDSLSGLLHMAHGLQQEALKHAASADVASSLAPVSVEVQLSGVSWLRAAAPAPGAAAPRLRVRKVAGSSGTIELSTRDLQVASGGGAVSAAWAWPMPAVQPAKLQQYEAGLKELLARHGLDGKQQVDNLSLTEVVVDVTTLLSVEFEVERERQEQNLTAGDGMFNIGAGPHEVWRAVLAVKPERAGKVSFQPLQAQLVDASRSSIAISPLAEAMRMGNVTLPDNMPFVYPSMI